MSVHVHALDPQHLLSPQQNFKLFNNYTVISKKQSNLLLCKDIVFTEMPTTRGRPQHGGAVGPTCSFAFHAPVDAGASAPWGYGVLAFGGGGGNIKNVGKIQTVFGLNLLKSILLYATYSFFIPSSVIKIQLIFKVNTLRIQQQIYNSFSSISSIVKPVLNLLYLIITCDFNVLNVTTWLL